MTDLIIYFFYMTVATTFLPLPTQPGPLYLGQLYPPILIAVLGALGAAVAHWLEYHLVTRAFDRGRLSWLHASKRALWTKEKIRGHLLWGLLLSGATGIIPSDAVRLLAMISRYNPYLSAVAIFVARIPRYFFLAYLGERFRIPFPYIIGLFAVLIALALFHIWKRRRLLIVG